jgi:hypothetical protein
MFLFENPKNLGFLCSLSRISTPLGLASTYLDHQALPMVISDLIGSPGFAGDHLELFIGSQGFTGDHLGLLSAHQASSVTISDFYQLTRLLR